MNNCLAACRFKAADGLSGFEENTSKSGLRNGEFGYLIVGIAILHGQRCGTNGIGGRWGGLNLNGSLAALTAGLIECKPVYTVWNNNLPTGITADSQHLCLSGLGCECERAAREVDTIAYSCLSDQHLLAQAAVRFQYDSGCAVGIGGVLVGTNHKYAIANAFARTYGKLITKVAGIQTVYLPVAIGGDLNNRLFDIGFYFDNAVEYS